MLLLNLEYLIKKFQELLIIVGFINNFMTKQLQDLVPDLKICQEAKEKGVEIESQFWYKIGDSTGTVNIIPKEKLNIGNIHFSFYPAPLTDEILEVIKSKNKADSLEIVKKKDYL